MLLRFLWRWSSRRLWRRSILKVLNMPVGRVMTPFVNTVRRDDSLRECINLMIGEKVSCLVVEQEGKPVGIITERDFLLKSDLSPKVFDSKKVEDFMSENVVTISPYKTLSEAQELMRQHNFRKLVVVDNGGMVGILSQTDIVRAVEEFFSQKVDIHGSVLCENIMVEPVTVSPSASFEQVKNKMVKTSAGCVVVLDSEDVVGIVTEYDVIRELAVLDSRLRRKKVVDFMSVPVKCVASDLNVFEANKIMLAEGVRRLPVLLNGRLVGLLTQRTVTYAMFAFLRDVLVRINKHFFGDLKVRVDSDDSKVVYQKHGFLREFSL